MVGEQVPGVRPFPGEGGEDVKGHTTATDEQIRTAYKTMSIRHICKSMHVGVNRVRAVLDAEGMRRTTGNETGVCI